MEIWRKHDSDNKIRSKGFTLEKFQELFGDSICSEKISAIVGVMPEVPRHGG